METINKVEQLARIHANCKIESGFVLVTIPEFINLAAGRAYRIIETGDEIKVTAKRSGDGSGKKTIYIGEVNGKPFEGSIEDLKNDLNITYRRPKDGSSNCKTALGKLHYEVTEKVSKLIEACTEEITESEFTELKAAYHQMWALVGTFRKAQKEAAEKERAEKEAAEKEAKKIDKIKSLLATLTPEQRKALGL